MNSKGNDLDRAVPCYSQPSQGLGGGGEDGSWRGAGALPCPPAGHAEEGSAPGIQIYSIAFDLFCFKLFRFVRINIHGAKGEGTRANTWAWMREGMNWNLGFSYLSLFHRFWSEISS